MAAEVSGVEIDERGTEGAKAKEERPAGSKRAELATKFGILELLDQGRKLADIAAAVGTYPREVRRIGWRYLERGLEAALSEDPRPKPAPA